MADFATMLPTLYDRLGDVVTYTPVGGGEPMVTKALFSAPGQNAFGGEVIVTDFAIRYRVASLPGVVRGDQFVIGDVAFQAREAPLSMNDGAEAMVALSKVST